jgi:hypothetical protein
MTNADLRKLLDNLERRVWTTRGARFNAARRLGSKQYWSIASVSFLSVYGISIPILQSSLDPSACPGIVRTYSVVATILSVFILVLSLLEGYRNYQVKAVRLYSSALDLSHLCREIEFLRAKQMSDEELLKDLKRLSDSYEKLIKECQENHDIEDYLMFRAQKRRDFDLSRKHAIWDIVIFVVRDYWLYFISITAFPLPIALLYISCQ